MTIKRSFFVSIDEGKWVLLSAWEVKDFIDQSKINPYQYLYCQEKDVWIRAKDLEEIHIFYQNLSHNDENRFPLPNFKPPMFMPAEFTVGTINIAREKWEVLQSQIKVMEEREEYWKSLAESKKEINLEEGVTPLSYGEIDLEKEEFPEEKDSEFRSQLDELNELVEQKNKELQEAINENQRLANALKQVGTRNKEINEKYKNVEFKLKSTQKNNLSLKQSERKLKQGISVLKIKAKKQRMHIKNLEKYKETQLKKEKAELDVLMGDSFQVDNNYLWFVELDGSEKGPFRFEDVESFLKHGKINRDTQVKKRGEDFWKPLNEFFEFSSKVIAKEIDEGGRKVKKYFIKRAHFRAPFHEVASIYIDGLEYRGYCTSLSAGGCFLELNEIEKAVMLIGREVEVSIVPGTLSDALHTTAIIRNLSEKRPRGVGLQFSNLEFHHIEIIEEFVNKYLEMQKKTAA